MASKMYNRARMTVTSTGTGALSLGVAVAGYQTFSSAGAQNSDTVSYTIEDGVNWEIGTGTFNSVAGTLSRTVTQSFNGTTYGTSAISVTTNAQVYITALAADIVVSGGALGTPSSATLTNATGLPLATGVTGTLPVANGGTGLTSLYAGYIPYGNGTGAFGSSANLYFDGTNLGVGTSTPDTYAGRSSLSINGTSGGILTFQLNGTQQFRLFVGSGSTTVQALTGTLGFSTAAASDMTFATNGSERMRLDAAGNLGLGVTPSAWLSSFKATQIGNGAAISGRTNTSSQIFVTSNAYIDSGATWRYLASDYAVRYYHDSGKHIWDIASSGTAAGAISFTQAMTLDASGRLGIGLISPAYKLDVFGERLHLQNTSGSWVSHMIENDGGSSAFYIGINDSAGSTFSSSGSYGRFLYSAGAYPLDFYTNSSLRARIDSSGNLLVGTTSAVLAGKITVQYSGASARGISLDNTYNGTVNAVSCSYNGTYVGGLTSSATATALVTSSDVSLKENIAYATSALSSMLSLPIRQFDWKVDGSHTDYGVVAQEAYEHAPEMVTQGELWSVDYGRITPRLIKAFQELAAKVSALEAKQ